jgi:hypothetical protein
MMADNKEQRVREVLFSVRDCSEPIVRQSGSEQSLTENKTSRTLIISHNKNQLPPNRHLEKSHNNNNTQPRLTPRGRLLEYCVDSRHLAAHRATNSSSRATFKFRLFLDPPRKLLYSGNEGRIHTCY